MFTRASKAASSRAPQVAIQELGVAERRERPGPEQAVDLRLYRVSRLALAICSRSSYSHCTQNTASNQGANP